MKSVCGVDIGTQDKNINSIISRDEIHLGTCLVMDSLVDISCVNKHAFIKAIAEVTRVDAVPFDKKIGKLGDLPIINAIYAY